MSSISIQGTIDNYTPTYEPDAAFKIWSIEEIWDGTEGLNRYVPKVNDWVVDPPTFTVWIVTDLHPVTYVPEMTLIRPFGVAPSYSEEDALLGPGVEAFRAYVDKTNPDAYLVHLDHTLYIKGSNATHARVYLGTLIEPSKIISRLENNNGEFISNLIPLETVAYNTHDNYYIKRIPGFIVRGPGSLQSGEILTVAVYDTQGVLISKAGVVVEESTYISRDFAEQKYVTAISMKSPFTSDLDPNTINFPVNIPLNSFSATVAVHYNDGSKVETPLVSNPKFTLLGIDSYVPSVIGHKTNLILRYSLSAGEAAIGVGSNDNSIRRSYTIVSSEVNTSYNVKVFVYPQWVDASVGYILRVWMMSLDRNILFDVTPHFTVVGTAFNGNSYNQNQTLQIRLNLANVSGMYRDFVHIQNCSVVLRSSAVAIGLETPWEVLSPSNEGGTYYGSQLMANTVANNPLTLRVSSGIATLNDWLNQTYYRTKPLTNPITEAVPLVPTHFDIRYTDPTLAARSVIDIPIADYDSIINLAHECVVNRNVTILFKRTVGETTLLLSVAEMLIIQG